MKFKFLIAAMVRKQAHSEGLQSSAKFLEKFDWVIADLFKKACERALESKRRTLLARDI